MKVSKYLLTTFIFLLFATITFSQAKDTTIKPPQRDSIAKKSDSLNSAILQNFNKKLNEIEQLRIADSIAKSKLEIEINSLKSSDNLKKEELEKQLQELRNKEAMRFAEKKRQVDSLRTTAIAYPVLGFFEDTLFNIFNRSGSFTAQDRAGAIMSRIKGLKDAWRFKTDSIQIVSSDVNTDLVYKDVILLSISDNDALWENSTRDQLAENYRKIIGAEVIKYKKETSFSTLTKEPGSLLAGKIQEP
jgi:hypothetical protein